MTGQLHDTRILITREKRQAKHLADLVTQYGGIPVVAPLLTISCKRDNTQQNILNHLPGNQWIFFTSANGVHCFFTLLKEQGLSMTSLSTCYLGAVGSKTAVTLKDYGYAADFIPSTYNADMMAEEFLSRFSTEGPVLLVKGSMSRSVLSDELAKNMIPYETIEVYETLFNDAMKVRINELIRDKAFDMITFTSPSTVEAFMEMKTDSIHTIQSMPVACIGTTTEKEAQSVGFTNTFTPDSFTINRMIAKIIDYISKKG